MQSPSNRGKAVKLLQTVGAGNPDYDLLAGDAMWWILGREEYPARQFLEFTSAKQFLPGGKNEILVITAEHDRVAIEVRSFEQTPDGREYSNQYHFLVEFRGGLVIRVKEYLDTAYANGFYGTDMFSQRYKGPLSGYGHWALRVFNVGDTRSEIFCQHSIQSCR